MKKIIKSVLLLLVLFALSAVTKAQISVDNTSSVSDFTLFGVRLNPVTFSHTITNNGEVLYVGISNNITGTQAPATPGCTNLTRLTTAGTVTAISYGSQTNFEPYTTNALDPTSRAVISPDGCTSVEIYRLINPQPGTATISVTVTGGGDYLVIGAVSFSGVSQSTPTAGGLNGFRGTSTAPTATVATGANDFVLDVVAAEFAAGLIDVDASSTGQTERYSGMFPAGTVDIGAASTKPAAVGFPTTTTLWTLNNPGEWAVGGILIEDIVLASPSSISGFVNSANGRRLPDTLVIVQNLQTGEQFYTHTDSKGSYFVEDLETGVSYSISVFNYKYQFSPSSRVVSLLGSVEDLNFIGSIRRRNLTLQEWKNF